MLETTNNSTGEKIRIEFNQKYQKKSEIKSLAHAVFCLPAVYIRQDFLPRSLLIPYQRISKCNPKLLR